MKVSMRVMPSKVDAISRFHDFGARERAAHHGYFLGMLLQGYNSSSSGKDFAARIEQHVDKAFEIAIEISQAW